MSEEIHEEKKRIKSYFIVFGFLVVLAIVNVAVSYLHLGGGNIVAGLIIAGVQALLALGILMHMFWEKKTIHQLIGLAVLFVLALFLLLVASYFDSIGK
ncbi:cytochrome C oxidase subunit IV family protein [Candidatus Methylacidiphilum infernorum]|uniref:Cytochrome C oxidase subunit IV family protein n=1 Tax=Candidatus Methylacidiphilum infernorum TaxID=511746 RepID=A0ABX7PX64_9BACT|nr:cytochrome C oxidase subunit IV family protein [Candidatus Methylacidiphilum infernorum]QSR87415.1 cytochrome C oxidase subunit IV family protein [Candidatus Methylacidiphilum infernorum]